MESKTINWELLAFMRFLLAFIVFAGHASSFSENVGPLPWINTFGSFEAILGFLLISGLSIGKSILRNQKGFLKRRVQRIYPVYIASIIFCYIIDPHPISIGFIFFMFINLIFLNHVLTSTSFVGPAWTLSLEVWLYALAPFFFKLSYKKLLVITYVSFLCYCLYTCGRTLFHWPYYAGTEFGINLIFLSFIWLAGFSLAVYKEKLKNISLHIAVFFVLHFVLTTMIQIAFRIKNQQPEMIITADMIDFVGKAICLFGIYYVVILNPTVPSFSLTTKKVFNLLGNISYPLYLTHMSVIELCKKLNIIHWQLVVLFSLVVAFLVYWSFDFYSKRRTTKEVSRKIEKKVFEKVV